MADAKPTTATKSVGGPLAVNLVTPTGAIAQAASTNAVTAPGELGEFEVLPGHIPFLTTLHAGVLMFGEGKNADVYAVSRGYLRVSMSGEVEILVERALAASKIDEAKAKSERDQADKDLVAWKDQPQNAEWKNIKDRYDWAQAQLDARARL